MRINALANRETGIAVLLLLTVATVQCVNPQFLSFQNVKDLFVQAAPFAVIACGMTLVVLLGEIDISIGSMAGVLSALMGLSASASHWGLPLAVTVALVVGCGAAFGCLNGVLVAYVKVPSIIVTLGMLTILKGVTQALLGGNWITGLPPDLRWFGTGSVLEVPVPVIVAALVVGLTGATLTLTPFGRRIYAVGSNPKAAEVRGLPSKRLVLCAFTILGLLTGLATLISAPQLSVVESGFGAGWELFVVTCVVVGGVSINGGRGNLTGVVLSVVLLGIIKTVLIFLKLGDQAVYWERSIQGAFILVAALSDRTGRERARSVS